MPENIHFDKAPIIEAIIDLRVEPQSGDVMPLLEGLRDTLKGTFPDSHNMLEVAVQIDDVSGSHTQSINGYRLFSEDKQKVIQIRRDGFGFSLLHPYDRWDGFCDEARRLWDMYRNALQPVAVTRTAVRYINRIDIPLPSIDIKEYFRTSPEVSPDLPQMLQSYLMRLILSHPESGGTAVIQQALVNPPNPDTTSVILDIDLFREQEIPQGEEEIWDLFEQLRDGKNQIFRACITDKTEELIS